MKAPRKTRRTAVMIVGWAVLMSVPATGRSEEDCEFKAGMSLFVAAKTTSARHDLDLEKALQREFRKRRAFQLADQSSLSDLVFLVIAEYRSHRFLKTNAEDLEWWEESYETRLVLQFAEGFALTRKAFLRGFRTREELRSVACWQWMVGSENAVTSVAGRASRLVKAYHDHLESSKVAVPAVAEGSSNNLIRPGQSVYLAAFKETGTDDIHLEGALIREFTRHGTFHVTGDLGDADFVFLAYSRYEVWRPPVVSSKKTTVAEDILTLIGKGKKRSNKRINVLTYAEGIAVTPEEFEEHLLDAEMLRRLALWRSALGNGRLPKLPKRYHRRLVTQFHEEVSLISR